MIKWIKVIQLFMAFKSLLHFELFIAKLYLGHIDIRHIFYVGFYIILLFINETSINNIKKGIE